MEKINVRIAFTGLFIALFFAACTKRDRQAESFDSRVVHPEWSKDMVLYEVNVRQYTPEGTFRAFAEHLPRLRDLGVNVLWFMPTYPIGEVNRKGELGSYYSIKDFKAVNPEFGTLEDFRTLIGNAHSMGMHVLLDWVPNHTSWDNPLTEEHPEFYVKDKQGRFTPPAGTDWTDVIQLDWSREGLHDYMIEAMAFWIELGADGFRVDHPHNTPPEFWERARDELNRIKPVFLLAEHEGTAGFMEEAFDMNYAWELHHLLKSIAQGKDSVKALHDYYEKELKVYPQSVYRLQFLSNHDENSWAGTIDSLFGDAHEALANLIFTARGVPLLYSGQEVCLNKRLRFFERDTISWDSCKMTDYYADLIRLKKENRALWNGDWGGTMEIIGTDRDNRVFAYSREKDNNKIVVFLNLTAKDVSFTPGDDQPDGDYTEIYSGEEMTFPAEEKTSLEPWGYKVYVGN